MGIGILGLCANRSGAQFATSGGCIRIGLRQVKNLSERSVDRMLRVREERRFESLTDFLSRVKISQGEVENLVLGGAFDFTARSRPQLIWELKTACPLLKGRARGRGLMPPCLPRLEPPALKDYSPWRKLMYELSALELSPTAHPMSVLRPMLRERYVIGSSSLPERVGRSVRVGGVLSARHTNQTTGGAPMQFLTLEDEEGIFEVTVFPGPNSRFGRNIAGYGPYLVEGKVEAEYGVLSVNARRVRPLFDALFASAADRRQAEAAASPLASLAGG